MHTRFLISLFAVVVLLGTAGYLLSEEDVSIRTEKQVTKRKDPFEREEWKENRWRSLVTKMGLPKSLRSAILDKSKARKARLGAILLKKITSSANDLQRQQICGRAELPRRYALLDLLAVERNNGDRTVLQLKNLDFESSPWLAGTQLRELHEKMDLLEDGPDQATARIVSAVFSQEEAKALSYDGSWKRKKVAWSTLLKDRSLKDQLVEYFANLLVVATVAQEGGVCKKGAMK